MESERPEPMSLSERMEHELDCECPRCVRWREDFYADLAESLRSAHTRKTGKVINW